MDTPTVRSRRKVFESEREREWVRQEVDRLSRPLVRMRLQIEKEHGIYDPDSEPRRFYQKGKPGARHAPTALISQLTPHQQEQQRAYWRMCAAKRRSDYAKRYGDNALRQKRRAEARKLRGVRNPRIKD